MTIHHQNKLKITITIVVLTALAIIISNCSSKLERYKQTVSPPVLGADISFQQIKINADSNTIIATPTGTQIQIKPGTFITKNGQKAKGDISIKYREFHNAYDILSSGIPMSTNEDRSNFLQSAGMIEIRAYQKENELNIEKNKKIDIQLAAYKPSDGYSLYYLNDNINWETRDTFYSGVNSRKSDMLAILTKLAQKPGKDSLQDFVFELAADLTTSPYLKPFKNIQWKVAASDITPKILEGIRVNWDEVSITELNHHKMKYKLKFTKKMDMPLESLQQEVKYIENSIEVVAKPMMHQKNTKQDKQAIALQMKVYNETLEKIAAEKIRVLKEADLVNSFKINRMGIWNIDKLQKKDDIIFSKINFDFEKEIDPIINHIKIFVVYEEENSVMQYFPNDLNKVGLQENKKMRIIAVLPDNKIAVVDDNEIKGKMLLNKEKLFLSTHKEVATAFLKGEQFASK